MILVAVVSSRRFDVSAYGAIVQHHDDAHLYTSFAFKDRDTIYMPCWSGIRTALVPARLQAAIADGGQTLFPSGGQFLLVGSNKVIHRAVWMVLLPFGIHVMDH